MLRAILMGIALLLAAETTFAADQPATGYYLQDGTYIEPYDHMRPPSYLYDNYSRQKNVHPWTARRVYAYNAFSNPPAYNYFAPFSPLPQIAPLFDSIPYRWRK